jgi:zinc protease
MSSNRLGHILIFIGLVLSACNPLTGFRTAEGAENRNAAMTYEKVTEKTLFNGDHLLEYKLANGLKVILIPRHQAKVLTYQVWFNVGSVDEKLDPKLRKTGLAHLFEHMMFRGSEKHPFPGFDHITARIGADRQNATTHFYRTNYFESIPSNQLATLMELEADRMRNLKLTKENFETEKGAVVGEFRRHLDSPISVGSDELNRLMYDVSPYRFTVLGTEAEIKGFTLEEAQYFYKTFYAPNNATLIVVGDVEPEPFMKLVLKNYGDMAPQKIPKSPPPQEPRQTKTKKFETTHPQATSETLFIGYHIPGINSPDTVPLSLMQAHLTDGTEAELRKLLVDNGIAVGAQAEQGNQPDVFEFVVQMAEKHKSEEAIKIIDGAIKRLQKTKLKAEELERSRNQELLGLYSQIGDHSEMASLLGEYLMLSGNYLRGLEIVEAYKTVTAGDIQRVAKEYLTPENRSIVIVRPEKKK